MAKKSAEKEKEELEKLEEELASIMKSSESEDQDNLLEQLGTPTQEKKESVFRFFRHILGLEESWKVGNLKDPEIGNHDLSIRAYLELARYAKAKDFEIINLYFRDMAGIIAAPTMGRKGFLAQLFVTQIKREQKINKSPEPSKGGWFNRGGSQQSSDGDT